MATGALLAFFIGNSMIAVVTDHVDGLSCIFYLSFGAWITGIIYQSAMSIKNYRDPDVDYTWHRNNIIVDNKLNCKNLVLWLLQCCLFFLIMSSIFMTMYFSHMSGINVGVITTIWNVQPLIAAIVDYIIYR